MVKGKAAYLTFSRPALASDSHFSTPQFPQLKSGGNRGPPFLAHGVERDDVDRVLSKPSVLLLLHHARKNDISPGVPKTALPPRLTLSTNTPAPPCTEHFQCRFFCSARAGEGTWLSSTELPPSAPRVFGQESGEDCPLSGPFRNTNGWGEGAALH